MGSQIITSYFWKCEVDRSKQTSLTKPFTQVLGKGTLLYGGETPSNPSDMGEMGLILDRYYKKQAILKKEQAKLSLKNELGIIFSAHPPTIPCFYLRLWPPGWAKVTEGKAKGAHTLPVPGQNGSRKCESSQKPPGDPVGVGAGFLVLEASSNGTSKSWAKLSRWCAPR